MKSSLKNLLFWSLSLALALSLSNCSSSVTQIPAKAYGQIDGVLLVCEPAHWDGQVGDSLRKYLAAPYPVLPRPEPYLDLRHEPPGKLNNVLLTRRTILFVANLNDTADATTKIVLRNLGTKNIQQIRAQKANLAFEQDRWASGQLVIYWFGDNLPDLLSNIAKDHQKIRDRVRKSDEDLLMEQLYHAGLSLDAQKALDSFKIKMKIPKEYRLAVKDSSSIWLRLETAKVSNDLFISILPDTIMGLQYALNTRNRLTAKYFSTRVEGSFMQVDDRYIKPQFEQFTWQGMPAIEVRGIWYMVNDFMGGPFISYFVKDEKNKRILLIDGFVHAPTTGKKPEMRRIEGIISTVKFN
jgi:hypothetical protein